MVSTALLGSALAPLLGASVSGLGLRSAGTSLCGEIKCQVYEFCSSEVDQQCRRCGVICDSKSRNYDENTCDQFCQDYIHDFVRHYIKKVELHELEAQVESLKSLVGVSLMVGVLLCFLSLLSVLFMWIKYRKLLHGNTVGDSFYKKKMDLIKYISRTNNNSMDPTATIITPTSTLPQVITVNSTSDSAHNHHAPPRLAPPSRPDLSVAIPGEDCRFRTEGGRSSRSGGGRGSASPPSTSSTQLCGQLPRYPSEDATLEHAAYDNLGMTPTPPRTALVNERY